MSLIELKQKLHTQIDLIDNDEVLEEIYRILELGNYNKEENSISDDFKSSIDKGLSDFKEGKYISNEEAKGEFKKWLNK